MKSVFKTTALAVIGNNNEFNDFYEKLIKKITYHTLLETLLARRIASITLGVFKSGKKYKPYGERKNVNNNKTTL